MKNNIQLYNNPNKRITFCKYFQLTSNEIKNIQKLLNEKRIINNNNNKLNKKITITNILSACMLVITNILIQNIHLNSNNISNSYDSINLRFLLSVGLRTYGKNKLISEKIKGKLLFIIYKIYILYIRYIVYI